MEELKMLLKEVIKHEEAHSAILLYIISNGNKEKLARYSELYKKLVEDKSEIWNFDFEDDPSSIIN